MEYENEPTPGLPGSLPAGEHILWQGSPDWRSLARTAFHTRLVAGYFALLVGWAVVDAASRGIRGAGDLTGIGVTILVGAMAVALLHVLAWASARTTIYTLTNRRVVMRIGIALPKCANFPLGQVAAVDLAARNDGTGDLPLSLIGQPRLGYLALWPHARAWKIVKPQPMLRSIPDAADVAGLIARTCLTSNPQGHVEPVQVQPRQAPGFAEVAAA